MNLASGKACRSGFEACPVDEVAADDAVRGRCPSVEEDVPEEGDRDVTEVVVADRNNPSQNSDWNHGAVEADVRSRGCLKDEWIETLFLGQDTALPVLECQPRRDYRRQETHRHR